ncbi:MAG: tetratricopeptide repeat protein, partial [Stellaceae bacterium]
MLRPLLAGHPADLVLHFLVGECLLHMGKPRAAIAEYRFVLARDPEAIRARASLGAAEAAAGDVESARRDLSAVLAQDLPPPVRAKLQASLDSLPSRSRWSGAVTFGAMYDSNPAEGSGKSAVALFGAPFLLTGSARERGDAAALATASLRYDYAVNANWALRA